MSLLDGLPASDWAELESIANRGLDLTSCDCPSRSYLNARRPDDLRSFRSFAEHVETAIAIGEILWNREVTGVVCACGGTTRIVDEPTDAAFRTLLFEQSALSGDGSVGGERNPNCRHGLKIDVDCSSGHGPFQSGWRDDRLVVCDSFLQHPFRPVSAVAHRVYRPFRITSNPLPLKGWLARRAPREIRFIPATAQVGSSQDPMPNFSTKPESKLVRISPGRRGSGPMEAALPDGP